MFPKDVFLRLPTPTALLLLSSLMGLTSAHVARQTPTTIPYRSLNVVPLPAPTLQPLGMLALKELLRRDGPNTVCGYIDSDPKLPATCSVGSHCVKDSDQNVIGCCPNGQDSCTAGVYTSCVDSNSGAQSELNPYVFTCTGSNVCYKNVFDGGASQYGCGTASDLAATVANSATGLTSGLTVESVSVSFTDTISDSLTASSKTSHTKTLTSGSLTTTLTIPSPKTSTHHTSKTTSSTSTTGTTSSNKSPTTGSSTSSSSTSSPSGTDAPSTSGASSGGVNRTGAIVGGTVAGVAVLAALIALVFFLWRRRARGNTRQGPGPRPGDTQYISPMSGGSGFSPLGSTTSGAATVKGKTITHITGGPAARNTVWQYSAVGDGSPTRSGWGTTTAGGAAAGAAAAGGADAYRGPYASPHDDSGEDEVPLRHGSPEIEDFSRGFNDALSRIGEEDEEDLDAVNGSRMSPNGNGSGYGDTGDLGEPSAPLWLQPRRQSRNLMWT